MKSPPFREYDPSGTLATYGWSESVLSSFQETADEGTVPVRVVRVDRGSYVVATASGVARCHPASATDPAAVTGDWAAARPRPGLGLVLDTLIPRTTEISRLNREGSGAQVLVANVDTMFVLHGVDRPHRVGRLERLCILTWEAGANPVIVLTKTDLLGTDEAVIGLIDAIEEIGKVIRGVDVMPVSSTTGAGVTQLGPYLVPGTTIGVVGESGAGKSTLINRLIGAERQTTGRTRRGDHKGRHTTTSRELIPLGNGAVLVDTPGLRTIGMLGGEAGLARAYDDLEALFAECRFRDCGHDAEPDCAVTAALRRGTLDRARWDGYQKLLKEMAFEARRAEERERRAEAKETGKRLRKVRKSIEEW